MTKGRTLETDERVVNLHSMSDAELNKYINDMTFTANEAVEHDLSYRKLNLDLLQFAYAEKNGRTSTKMARRAAYIAVTSLFVAILSVILSVVGMCI